MEKITFCIPSKNNLRYLKACIPSIRKNAYRPDHDISIFVDKDEDGTIAWLESVKDVYNIKYYVNPDLNKSLFGIGKAYDYCIERAETEIFMIFHADMMLGKYADLEAYKYLKPSKVVCATRIEPPLHPEGVEKIVKNFGLWPEPDVVDGFKEKDFDEYVEQCKKTYANKKTLGCFAPWMMYKKDFVAIGMHDPIMKSAREDSDVFNRMVLNGYELIQSWQSFVYHLTCRGGQFEHGVLTQDYSKKSKDWQQLMHNSTLEFIRKWGSTVKHDEYLKPVIKNKYDIGFVVRNCNLNVLQALEPWCSTIYTDFKNINFYKLDNQKYTSFNLNDRIKPITAEKNNDVLIEFDASQLTQDRYVFLTEQLSDVLTESAEIGEMEYDIFKITIKLLKTYQNELVMCK
jgi:glycosyltransferase involved in cell wall biosynthesis